MTVGETVIIKQSRIKGAGRGVFALKDFVVKDVITKYEGKVVPNLTYLNREETAYSIDYGKDKTLVGYSERRNQWKGCGAASLINDTLCPCLESRRRARLINCTLQNQKGGDEIFAVACREIRAGDELYTSYRWSYWEPHFRHDKDKARHVKMHRIIDDMISEYGNYMEIPESCLDFDALLKETLLVRWRRIRRELRRCDTKCFADEIATTYNSKTKSLTIVCQSCFKEELKIHPPPN